MIAKAFAQGAARSAWPARPRCLAALCVSAALVTGCADVSDTERSYAAGWRIGYVAALGTSVEVPRGADGDCRESASGIDADINLFALVNYVSHRGAMQHRVVPVGTERHLKQGDWVYVNVDHCLAPVVCDNARGQSALIEQRSTATSA